MKNKLSSEMGVLSSRELAACPGYPGKEELERGPVAVIECTEEIPCNPCQTICPGGAIVVGKPITNLPIIDREKCNGCGLCIPACPGLAIFVVDNTYSEKEAVISFPHEYLPLPKEGNNVNAVNREGKIVCTGRVVKVRNSRKYDHTPVITIAVDKKYSSEVRGIELQGRVRV